MSEKKRWLSLLLALLLCLSCFTGTASAAKGEHAGENGSAVPADEFDPRAEEPVTVILRMEGEPAAKSSVALRGLTEARLTLQHEGLRRNLKEAGLHGEEICEYRTLLNGFALTLPRKEMETLAELPGVKSVHVAASYGTPASDGSASVNEMTGAAWMHRSDYLGSGTVIAVLDTGITLAHEAFAVHDGMLKSVKLTESEAKSKIKALGCGTFVSSKIPFVYNYSGLNNEVSDLDSGHGTGVAGIAAGYARGEDGSLRYCGTAPDAQLLIMKLYDSDEEGTNSAICFQALEDAFLLGADVINLSLGEKRDHRDSGNENEVFGEIFGLLRENGVLVNVAAGDRGSMAEGASNAAGSGFVTADYADYGDLSAAATWEGNLGVASAENALYPVHVLRADERDIPLRDYGDQFFEAFYQSDEPPVEYTVVPGFGEPEDYEGLMIEGRIALTAWGGISLREKLDAAAEAGAIGLLIYTDEANAFSEPLEDDPIPAAAISLADGEYLISLAEMVTPPSEPNPGEDSEEDLGSVYYRINSQEACVEGGGYLIVSQEASLVFNSGSASVNAPGNGVPVTIRGRGFPVNDTLRAAELRMESGCLTNDRGYLCCGGTVNEVRFSDSPEDIEIEITGEGFAEIVCSGCSFRYNESENVFRFFLPDNSLIGSEKAAVSLYRRGKAPTYLPTRIGILFFPEEPIAAENPRGWQLSAFSSMGVTPDLELKPSVTGVGGNVCAAKPGTTDRYEWRSGTALASANVSGGLACLLQYGKANWPELEPAAQAELAEALLLGTARVLTDEEGRYVSPRKQGGGLIDLQAAAAARAYIKEPVLSLKDGDTGEFVLRFEIQSLCEEALSYNLDLTSLRDLCETVEGSETLYNTLKSRNVSRDVTLLGDSTVVLPAGDCVSVELTLQLSEELLQELRSDFPNGGWLDGFLALSAPEEACTGGENCPGSPFEDMPSPRNWAHPGIDFVLTHELFSGTSPSTFSPGVTMSRGMMVTVLYSLAGKPEPEGENIFTDVKPGRFYEKPVIWASENGIVSGIGEGLFDPNGDITREQMALIMYRFAEYAGLDTDVSADIEGYPDVGRVHSYALTAMRWAVGVGILSGNKIYDEILLDPRSNATRAQVARLFMSFVLKCMEPPVKTAELHLSFTGFVGDWNAAPILEQHDWRKLTDLNAAELEVNTDINKAWAVGSAELAGETEASVYLGENPLSDAEFREEHAAISPQGKLNAVLIEPMTLRNARHLIMTASDAETGELYAADDQEYAAKAVWQADKGLWRCARPYLFDGTDLDQNPLPGGTKVDVRFYANLQGDEDALGAIDYEALSAEGEDWLVWSFSVTVDDEAPLVQNLRWTPAAKSLSFDLRDDQYLAYAELTPLPEISEDEELYYDPIWSESFSDEEAGSAHNAAISDAAFGEYTLSVWDYAGNETKIRLSLGSSGSLNQIHFVCPEGCTAEGVDLWYASNEAGVTMPGMDGVPETGAFYGWVPEALEGVWSLQELEDAAVDVFRPGDQVEMWGNMSFYALLAVPGGYISAQD